MGENNYFRGYFGIIRIGDIIIKNFIQNFKREVVLLKIWEDRLRGGNRPTLSANVYFKCVQ